MKKNKGIFKGLKSFSKNNPTVVIAIFWVSLMPSLCSLFLVPWSISQVHLLQTIDFYAWEQVIFAIGVSTLLMGLALMPTTLIAGLSGFMLGWPAFPWLVLGYTLATLLGYGWGKGLGGESLGILLDNYPKANFLIQKKKHRMGELIFFVRLSPVIPFALSNLLFALLNTGWRRLVLYGTIGMLPRTTLVFLSGTLASDIYSALRNDGLSGKTLLYFSLLGLSIWGIWRFFGKDSPR